MPQLSKFLALSALLAAGLAHAVGTPADTGTGATFTLNKPVPSESRGAVMTDLAPPAPASSAPVTSVPLVATPAPQLPTIPAAGPITPAPAASAAAAPTAAQLPGALVPGEPAKTYQTMQAAAAAGIDPLRVLSAPVRPQAVPAAFNYADPYAYVAWANSKLGENGLFIGLGVLVAGFVLLVQRRRSN